VKTVWGSVVTAPINLYPRNWCAPQSLYLLGNRPWYPLDRRLGGHTEPGWSRWRRQETEGVIKKKTEGCWVLGGGIVTCNCNVLLSLQNLLDEIIQHPVVVLSSQLELLNYFNFIYYINCASGSR